MGAILRFFGIGLLAIVALLVALKVVGFVVGAGLLLLVTVGPIALIGYGVTRLMKPKERQISAEDRRWLES